MGDWLAGYGDGLRMPGSLPDMRAIVVTLDGEWPDGVRPRAHFTRMVTQHHAVPCDYAKGQRPRMYNPQIAVYFGNHGSSWSSLKPRVSADAETAQVQVDQALARGRLREGDEHHARVLERFYEVVADANRVAAALAADEPLPAVSPVIYGAP